MQELISRLACAEMAGTITSEEVAQVHNDVAMQNNAEWWVEILRHCAATNFNGFSAYL